jgi:hypothetical protein
MGAEQLYLFAPETPPKRKTVVALTSIVAYHQEKTKGTFQTLRQKIFYLLASGATMTRRQLAKAVQKEPSSLTAALTQLAKSDLVEVGFVAKCPTTGKKVGWFKLCQNSVVESLTNAYHK